MFNCPQYVSFVSERGGINGTVSKEEMCSAEEGRLGSGTTWVVSPVKLSCKHARTKLN